MLFWCDLTFPFPTLLHENNNKITKIKKWDTTKNNVVVIVYGDYIVPK